MGKTASRLSKEEYENAKKIESKIIRGGPNSNVLLYSEHSYSGDLELIAAAPTIIKELLEEVKRLRK